MKIYLGTDHAGFELKEKIKAHLISQNHEVIDKGALEYDVADDYPDFIKPAALGVLSDPGSLGIVLGGSGQGEAVCANKIPGIRANVFYGPRLFKEEVDASGVKSGDPYELVKLFRLHGNANVLSLGARFLSEEEAFKAVDIFLSTPFSGDERHARRISKLENI